MLKQLILFRSKMMEHPNGSHEGIHPFHTKATAQEVAAFNRALRRHRNQTSKLRLVVNR